MPSQDLLKSEERMNGDNVKIQSTKSPRRASPDHAKKVRLRNLAEASLKQKQHSASQASSELVDRGGYRKVKPVVKKGNALSSVKLPPPQPHVDSITKAMSQVRAGGQESPAVKPPFGSDTAKPISNFDVKQQLRARQDFAHVGLSSTQSPTFARSAMNKMNSVGTGDKPGVKPLGKLVRYTPGSAGPVRGYISSVTTGKMLIGTTGPSESLKIARP